MWLRNKHNNIINMKKGIAQGRLGLSILVGGPTMSRDPRKQYTS